MCLVTVTRNPEESRFNGPVRMKVRLLETEKGLGSRRTETASRLLRSCAERRMGGMEQYLETE